LHICTIKAKAPRCREDPRVLPLQFWQIYVGTIIVPQFAGDMAANL